MRMDGTQMADNGQMRLTRGGAEQQYVAGPQRLGFRYRAEKRTIKKCPYPAVMLTAQGIVARYFHIVARARQRMRRDADTIQSGRRIAPTGPKRHADEFSRPFGDAPTGLNWHRDNA
jgi:hypothetical protein